MIHPDVERVLYTEEELRSRIAQLGGQITADYAGRQPMLVSVLRGSYIFMADLTRAIGLDVTVDFMVVSSYGAGTVSSGQVEIKKDLSDSIEGRDLIIVEDILDSGNTLYYLMDVLRARKPASIRICTLMDKRAYHRAVRLVYLAQQSVNANVAVALLRRDFLALF